MFAIFAFFQFGEKGERHFWRILLRARAAKTSCTAVKPAGGGRFTMHAWPGGAENFSPSSLLLGEELSSY